jgi:hypothetical protein
VNEPVLAQGRSLRAVDRRPVSTLPSTAVQSAGQGRHERRAGGAWDRDPRDDGRKSGQSRRTPVGRPLDGDACWIVAEHGSNASYVRNIQADPIVRKKIGRRWRTGTAHVMPDDDPRARA